MNLGAAKSGIGEARGGLSWRQAIASLAIIIVLTYLFGTFDRFPFDDEIITLVHAQNYTPMELLATRLGVYDLHPPLSYLVFQLLDNLGLPLWAMRFFSLLMSAIAFLLVLDLTLASIRDAERMVRLTTISMFLTFPLLYGVGDAMRWYPLFAMLVAGFFWLELRHRRPTITSGALLGLGASTNFLALFPYLAFAAKRYVIQRRFDVRVDGPFHLVMAVFAAPGLASFVFVALAALQRRQPILHLVPSGSILGSVGGLAALGLGFLGGYRIGPVEILLGLPFVALLGLALGSLALRRPGSEDPCYGDEMARNLLIITAVMTALCILYSLLTTFTPPHSLLFLAPFILACFALGYWRRFSATAWLPVCLASLLLFGTALVNARQSDGPFKRGLVIPYNQMASFVAENVHGSVLYVTPDIVSVYLMRHSGYCSLPALKPEWVYWTGPEAGTPPCAEEGLDRFDSIVIGIDPPQELPGGDAFLDDVRKHRRLHARARFGYDRWAALKNRLTGAALGPWIMTIEIYK